MKELVVGVAAPSDLAGSILGKILHCGEGRGVKQVARTSKQFSHVCDCLSFSLYSLVLRYLASSYYPMLDIVY